MMPAYSCSKKHDLLHKTFFMSFAQKVAIFLDFMCRIATLCARLTLCAKLVGGIVNLSGLSSKNPSKSGGVNLRVLSSIGTLLDRFNRFLLWDNFPLALAIILFFASSLDFGMTYHVFINYPDLFYELEGNSLARQVMGTDKWWILHIINAIAYTHLLLGAYLFNPRHPRFKDVKWIWVVRCGLLYISCVLLFSFLGWWHYL